MLAYIVRYGKSMKVKNLALHVVLLMSLMLIHSVSASPPSSISPNPTKPLVIQIDMTGPIGPATADYVTRSLQQAIQRQAQFVIIQMDTQGGLDSSIREITEAIIAAPLPVVSFVALDGAHTASAGIYIVYASHIAAMAADTHLKFVSPTQLDSAERDNSAKTLVTGQIMTEVAAYLRSLAKIRGRSLEWVEQSVNETASLSAEQAMNLGVIDLLAHDSRQLLHKLDGYSVMLSGRKHTLHTAHATIEHLQPDWRSQLLAIITNPNVAYILMLIGIYGLVFELSTPGGLIPGVIGALCLLLSLYALQTLPINPIGLTLILLGIAFMIAEAFIASFAILGISGTFAFVIGSIMLMDTGIPGFNLDFGIIFALAIGSVLFLCLGLSSIVSMRNQHIVSGSEELLNSTGIVEADFDHSGWILIHGEKWQAETDRPLQKGEKVQVRAIDELTLFVTPTHPQHEEH